MVNKQNDKTPAREADAFWEMAALALAGRLASCQSCVEFFYFQSQQNAVAFLDSCARGGLVEKMSLLDLRGDLQPISFREPTLRQQWYNQPIYISAPAFRKNNLDASRDRIEGTKNAVYNAFRLYYEKLKANDDAIDAAYEKAVSAGNLLRYADLAAARKNIDLSHVAKLRLIQDGFKCALKTGGRKMTPTEVERESAAATVDYIIGVNVHAKREAEVADRSEELEDFIFQFLTDYWKLEDFWKKYEERTLPSKSQLQVLRVIRYLIQARIETLSTDSQRSRLTTFVTAIRQKLNDAQCREQSDAAYSRALAELREDVDFLWARFDTRAPDVTASLSEVVTDAH